MTKKTKKNINKFLKKTGFRLLGKAIDLIVLVGIGYALGIHLVRGF